MAGDVGGGEGGAHPGLRLGGPSTARGEWIEEFLDWTRRRGCEPDFVISHFYNNDSKAEPLSPFDGPASHRVKDSPHFGAGVARGTRKLLDRVGFCGELHWNEWGRSWFPYDPVKETAQEAAYVVKTMAEVSQEADVFAFWCLSDIYDQLGYGRDEFQGNYGMLSLHGLRKPAYFGHVLLNRVVGVRVPVEGQGLDAWEGAVACRTERGVAVLVYRYPEGTVEVPERRMVEVRMPAGVGKVRLYRVDSRRNNIVTVWREMGAPEGVLRKEVLRELRQENELRWEEFEVVEGRVRFELECPGVALVEEVC